MNNTWSPQTIEEQARNYVEDLADFDRGNYVCTCHTCKLPFQGYKRRTTCKSCLIKHQEEKILELQNGKAIGSLHQQIVILEVKNATLQAQLENLKGQ